MQFWASCHCFSHMEAMHNWLFWHRNIIFSSSIQSKIISAVKRLPSGHRSLTLKFGTRKTHNLKKVGGKLHRAAVICPHKFVNKSANNAWVASPAHADRWQHLKAKQNERKKYENMHSKERWCNKALTLQREMEVGEEDRWMEGSEIN